MVASVRLPWAIGPPNGLSAFARSTSTWIHWWSPEISAKPLIISWVTVRQSLGPTVSPTRPCSSSMPLMVVGAMGRAYPLGAAFHAPSRESDRPWRVLERQWNPGVPALLAALAAALALALAAAPAAQARSADTAALQVALRAVHVYGGGVDGIAGPATRRGGAPLPAPPPAGRRRRRGAPHPQGARPPRAAPAGQPRAAHRPPWLGRRRAPVPASPPGRAPGHDRRRLRPRHRGRRAALPAPRPAGRRRRRRARDDPRPAPWRAPPPRRPPGEQRDGPAGRPGPVLPPRARAAGRRLRPALGPAAPGHRLPRRGRHARGRRRPRRDAVRRLEQRRVREPRDHPAPAGLPDLVRPPVERDHPPRRGGHGRHPDRLRGLDRAARPAPTCTSRCA